MTESQRRRLDRDQEIAGLEAERDYLTKQLLTIRAHAGDATEYVLAQINKELVEERDHLQTEFDSLAKSFLKSEEDKHNLITERDELRELLAGTYAYDAASAAYSAAYDAAYAAAYDAAYEAAYDAYENGEDR